MVRACPHAEDTRGQGTTIDGMRIPSGPTVFPRCLARLWRRGCCLSHRPRRHVLVISQRHNGLEHARPVDTCEPEVSRLLLIILIESRVRARPGMNATTFWASNDIPFERGAFKLSWTQNNTCPHIPPGYRALNRDHSHGIPSMQRLNRESIACMFPAVGRTAAPRSNRMPHRPTQRGKGPSRRRKRPSCDRLPRVCLTFRSCLTTQ